MDSNYEYGTNIASVLFVNPSTPDLHLQASSPCIDTGSSLLAPITDYDGNIRPQGNII